MNHEIPSTPEKDIDRQKVYIKRNNTGNVHPAYLTEEKDEQGRSIVEWFELDAESGKMVQRFKPIAEQNLGSEAQEALRRDYEQRLDEEIGGAALNAVDGELKEEAAEESGVDALEQLLEKTPLLREFSEDLRKIAIVRAREEKEGQSHGMNQYVSSEAMIDKLIDLWGQVQKSKIGEDRRGVIYKYIDHLL